MRFRSTYALPEPGGTAFGHPVTNATTPGGRDRVTVGAPVSRARGRTAFCGGTPDGRHMVRSMANMPMPMDSRQARGSPAEATAAVPPEPLSSRLPDHSAYPPK